MQAFVIIVEVSNKIIYQVFKVLGSLSSPDGSVWEIGSQSDGWKTLADGDIITGDHFLRLNISSSTPSGVAWFDITEMSGT